MAGEHKGREEVDLHKREHDAQYRRNPFPFSSLWANTPGCKKKKRKDGRPAGPFEKQISSFPGCFSGINICMRCPSVNKCYHGTSKRSNKLCAGSAGAQEQEGIIKVGA